MSHSLVVRIKLDANFLNHLIFWNASGHSAGHAVPKINADGRTVPNEHSVAVALCSRTPARWPSRLQSDALMGDFNELLFGLEAEQQVKRRHLNTGMKKTTIFQGVAMTVRRWVLALCPQ